MGNKNFKAPNEERAANIWIGRSPSRYRAISAQRTQMIATTIQRKTYQVHEIRPAAARQNRSRPGHVQKPPDILTIIVNWVVPVRVPDVARMLHARRRWNRTYFLTQQNRMATARSQQTPFRRRPSIGQCLADVFLRRPFTFKQYLNFEWRLPISWNFQVPSPDCNRCLAGAVRLYPISGETYAVRRPYLWPRHKPCKTRTLIYEHSPVTDDLIWIRWKYR